MSKYGSASFGVLLIDGRDMLPAKPKTFGHKIESVLEPTTGLGDSFETHTPVGMQRATLTQDGAFFDDVTSGMHETLHSSQATSRIVSFAPAGNAIGRPFVGCEGVYGMAYEVLAQVGALTKANVTYLVDGEMNRGVVLQAHEAETATWTNAASSVDNAASSADGGVGYLQVSASSGITNCVVKIRDSADDNTWADLITFTDNVVAPFAERIEVAGAVDRYTTVTGTVTGTGSITVFAGFARY
jgi:hypothetical protein